MSVTEDDQHKTLFNLDTTVYTKSYTKQFIPLKYRDTVTYP